MAAAHRGTKRALLADARGPSQVSSKLMLGSVTGTNTEGLFVSSISAGGQPLAASTTQGQSTSAASMAGGALSAAISRGEPYPDPVSNRGLSDLTIEQPGAAYVEHGAGANWTGVWIGNGLVKCLSDSALPACCLCPMVC